MAFDSLAQFVAALRRAGELADVRVRVKPYLEIAEITDRVVKAGGPALLFWDVEGSPYPVLTNQFGTEKRMALAFGARSLDEVANRVRNAVKFGIPNSLDGRFAKLLAVGSAAFAVPRTVTSAPVQEVVEHSPDLRELPILTTWPLDGGPFVTLPLVITKDPESGLQNVGMYRMQRYDAKTTGMHWQRHKQGRAQAAKWGRTVPVAVAIGADPAVTYAATAPLPPIVDEMSLAGFLRGRAVRMVRAKTIDLKVPADAEFILEGTVDNDDLRVEGPFGDHTGVYSLADRYPTFHVHCITRRRTPIYAATVVGKPPMEDAWLGKATERLFLPLLQTVVPEIVDYNLTGRRRIPQPLHRLDQKVIPGTSEESHERVMGARTHDDADGAASVVVVDSDVDVHDTRAVTWFALNNVDPSRDLVVMPGPVDDLDHSGSFLVAGRRTQARHRRHAKARGRRLRTPSGRPRS